MNMRDDAAVKTRKLSHISIRITNGADGLVAQSVFWMYHQMPSVWSLVGLILPYKSVI